MAERRRRRPLVDRSTDGYVLNCLWVKRGRSSRLEACDRVHTKQTTTASTVSTPAPSDDAAATTDCSYCRLSCCWLLLLRVYGRCPDSRLRLVTTDRSPSLSASLPAFTQHCGHRASEAGSQLRRQLLQNCLCLHATVNVSGRPNLYIRGER